MRNFTLSLSAYSDIKKMSFEEMSKWAAELYQKAYKAGSASVTSAEVFPAALRKVLQQADDIGPIRAEAVAQTIAQALCVPKDMPTKEEKIGKEK